MKKPSVLLFFIDGLGIGKADENNPLYLTADLEPLPVFQNQTADVIFDGALAVTDSRMGIEGRPQSASGQTTILTGVNAPQLLGHHKQGFPNAALRQIIEKNSIFRQLKNLEIEPNVFANAYTPRFFETVPRWKSATTCAVEAAEMTFRRFSDLLDGNAVFHDFTNQSLIEENFEIKPFSPEDAGEILARLTSAHRFTLYEHFITDKIGHARDFEKARRHLPPLAAFIRHLLSKVDLEFTTVILTSDHGNIEDLSIRTHTLNDVPTIVWGKKHKETAKKIKNLADITPAIVRLLN